MTHDTVQIINWILYTAHRTDTRRNSGRGAADIHYIKSNIWCSHITFTSFNACTSEWNVSTKSTILNGKPIKERWTHLTKSMRLIPSTKCRWRRTYIILWHNSLSQSKGIVLFFCVWTDAPSLTTCIISDVAIGPLLYTCVDTMNTFTLSKTTRKPRSDDDVSTRSSHICMQSCSQATEQPNGNFIVHRVHRVTHEYVIDLLFQISKPYHYWLTVCQLISQRV